MSNIVRKVALAAALMSAVALVGCGTTSTTANKNTAQAVAASPSKSARMICEQEAADQVARAIGVKTTEPVVPLWSHGLYSCRYVYPNGEIALSVKELSNQSATNAYFSSLQRLLGKKQSWENLGQAAIVTSNGSMVVRKDYKVLYVDITRLPAQFGVPVTTRSNAALNVATTIMGCWTGA